ncbi:hypothetical protein JCM33374_g6517 [Metschnikowia sp. JCM 33374]|nr:hypothetical protein JCM33374_g6517 [Metschnikowia sp. JCM 33374]
MTKYQRGELMEGWNDCPVPVSTTPKGVADKTSKARKRISRLPVVGSQPNSSESFAGGSSRSSLMPPMPSTLPPPPKAAPRAGAIEAVAEEELDFQENEAKLRKLVESAELSDKDKEFFSKRLVDAFPSLDPQHKTFVSQIVNGLAAKDASGPLKTQILNYMMANSGVSMWCVPLKKLVETLK